MSVNMHLRDVPEATHSELRRRAESKGMTLRQYTIEVLTDHCDLPDTDEWLDALARDRVRRLIDAAGAVRESRSDDDLARG